MIGFRRRGLWGRILRVIPAVRRAEDARLEAAIGRLVENPDLPCEVEGIVIPDGRGLPGGGGKFGADGWTSRP